MTPIFFLILAILIILSGVFSGTEIAIFSLSEARVRSLEKKKKKNSKILSWLRNKPDKTLMTILIGNNLMNIAASTLAAKAAIDVFGSLGVGIATGVMTFLILIFGEATPKAFARINAEKIALKMAPSIKTLMILLSPIVWSVDALSDFIISLTGKDKPQRRMTFTELRAAVKIGAEEGVIDKDEKNMIYGVFSLKKTKAKDVMTKRSKITAVDKDTMTGDVITKITRSGYTRLPVYSRTIDNIVGIVNAKDLLIPSQSGMLAKPIKKFMRKSIFVYEDKDIESLLDAMKKRNKHMAIVINKKKKVVGVVTIEDMLEEIVGEIYDETDKR